MFPNTTPFVESLASSQETAFLGYPISDLISTADAESDWNKAHRLQNSKGQLKSHRMHSNATSSSVCLVLTWEQAEPACRSIGPDRQAFVYRRGSDRVISLAPAFFQAFFPRIVRVLGEEVYKLHLNLVYPLQNGVIKNLDVARAFLNHIAERTGIGQNVELRAVIGMPSQTGEKAKRIFGLRPPGFSTESS